MNVADDTMSRPPALSVVVVVFAGGAAPERCLAALALQQVEGGMEIVVVHDRSFVPPADAQRRGQGVRWIAGEAAGSPARLRALGVRQARGAVVACTEDHCTPDRNWAERVVAAHRRGEAVVGGAIDKAAPASARAWAAYLLDYSRYMSPFAAGEAEYVSDCNVSYDRAVLEKIADVWRDEFHETTVHWALMANGHTLRLDPSIVVRQDRDEPLGRYLRERVAHGRTFAETRVQGASPAARAKWIALSVILPGVIVARVMRGLTARGQLGAPPIAAWPPLVASAVAWSVGELAGYLGRTRPARAP